MQALSIEVRRSQNRTDAYDEAVSDALGINRTDHRVIDRLDQEGPLTAGRLAELAGLTTGAMTAVLDRLEQAGFVRRVRDEDDRRRIHVELTDKVRQAVWQYYEPMMRLAAEIYGRYTDEQLELMLGFLQAANELSERELANLRAKLGK